MSNHFPTLPAGVHVAELSYFPYATQLSGGNADIVLETEAALGAQLHGPQMFSVGFDTGVSGGTISYDYSGFDQDVFEANLVTFLDAWCAYAVAVLGVTTQQAQATITVTRQWLVEVDEQVLGSSLTYGVYDTMTYPPAS